MNNTFYQLFPADKNIISFLKFLSLLSAISFIGKQNGISLCRSTWCTANICWAALVCRALRVCAVWRCYLNKVWNLHKHRSLRIDTFHAFISILYGAVYGSNLLALLHSFIVLGFFLESVHSDKCKSN